MELDDSRAGRFVGLFVHIQRVDREASVLELPQCSYMIFPRIGEDSDIVNVDINFGNVTEEVFHERLCNVGRWLYAHGQTIVPVVTEGSCNCARVLALCLELQRKGIAYR